MIKKIAFVLLKFVALAAIISVMLAAGIFVFINMYGKSFLEKNLSDFLGADIKFRTVSLDPANRALRFGGLTMDNVVGLDNKIFNADIFTVKLNKKTLENKKTIMIDEIIIEGAVINIERKPDGKIAVVTPVIKSVKGDNIPEGGNGPDKGAFYNVVNSVRKVSIKNSVVRFWDHAISAGGFLVICKNVSAEIITDSEKGRESGFVPVRAAVQFDLYNGPSESGSVQLAADMKVYKPFFESSIEIKGRNVDVETIKPYLDSWTPFIFTRGVFSLNSNVNIADNNIDSLTTVVFYNLRLSTNPRKQDSEFLQTSVNRLVPYLTSDQGEIIFDFVITGPVKSPVIGMGPRLKQAAGMAAMEEVGRIVQGMQNIQ